MRGNARYHAEEDHAGAGAAQGLVRGGRDDVAVLEGLRSLLRCHQATAPRTTTSHPTGHVRQQAKAFWDALHGFKVGALSQQDTEAQRYTGLGKGVPRSSDNCASSR